LLKSDLERDPRRRITNQNTSAQIERIERIVRQSWKDEVWLSFATRSEYRGRKLCDAMSPALDKRDIRLSEAFATRLPLMAGSSDRLQQLFLNLMKTASMQCLMVVTFTFERESKACRVKLKESSWTSKTQDLE
jgi:hypothetical protein